MSELQDDPVAMALGFVPLQPEALLHQADRVEEAGFRVAGGMLRQMAETAREIANLDYEAGGDLIHAEACRDSCIGWHDARAVAVALGITDGP